MAAKKKSSFTDGMKKRAIADLDKLRSAGEDIPAVINKTLVSGWTGFFPLAKNFNDKNSMSGGRLSKAGDDNLKNAMRWLDGK
jgi:hypothetical protein